MKICFWKNTAGRYPAKQDLEGNLDKRALKQLAKKLSHLGKYSFEQATRSETLQKVPDVGNLKLWETRFIISKGWARLMAVLEDPGPAVNFLTFFMKQKDKLPEPEKKRAVQNAIEFHGQTPPRESIDADSWAQEILKK